MCYKTLFPATQVHLLDNDLFLYRSNVWAQCDDLWRLLRVSHFQGVPKEMDRYRSSSRRALSWCYGVHQPCNSHVGSVQCLHGPPSQRSRYNAALSDCVRPSEGAHAALLRSGQYHSCMLSSRCLTHPTVCRVICIRTYC